MCALDGIATFHFVTGTYEMPVPRGLEGIFGASPHYTFFMDWSVRYAQETIDLDRIRELGETPEDVMRNFLPTDRPEASKARYLEDVDRLNQVIEREGPFQAVFGFSIGALVAGNLILDNLRRSKAKGRECDFKLAIFACGLPPCNFEEGGVLLVDSHGEVFPMPTCHIIGSNDPLIDFSLALYNLCNQEKAMIFDHGKGHRLVWNAATVSALAELLSRAIREIEAGGEHVFP